MLWRERRGEEGRTGRRVASRARCRPTGLGHTCARRRERASVEYVATLVNTERRRAHQKLNVIATSIRTNEMKAWKPCMTARTGSTETENGAAQAAARRFGSVGARPSNESLSERVESERSCVRLRSASEREG